MSFQKTLDVFGNYVASEFILEGERDQPTNMLNLGVSLSFMLNEDGTLSDGKLLNPKHICESTADSLTFTANWSLLSDNKLEFSAINIDNGSECNFLSYIFRLQLWSYSENRIEFGFWGDYILLEKR